MIENKNGKKIEIPDMRVYKCFACKAQIAPAGTPGWGVARAIRQHYALHHSKNDSGSAGPKRVPSGAREA